MTSPLILSIFTLNCWGIPWISKDRTARMNAIADHLAGSNYDFVCLQEVWSNDDFDLIKEKSKGSLPYSHYFHSGVIGSGVCILSKHPIKEALFHQWSVNGYCHKIQHGDWFGGKGVGLCRIDVDGTNINVYTAHLHAEYNRDNDEYLAHRVIQAFDTAQFVKLTSAPADVILIGGDLNTEPEDLAFRIIKSAASVRDAFDHGKPSEECNTTNESLRNSYRDSRFPPKRIDYILYRAPANTSMIIQNFELPLPSMLPDKNFSYSDHEALTATFKLKDSPQSTPEEDKINQTLALEEALLEGISICDSALLHLRTQRFNYTLSAFITLLVLLVTHYLLPYIVPNYFLTLLPFLSPILHIIFIIFLFFSIFMATIWNLMEINGILAGKLGMKITLGK